jgi:hypothetical protein
LVWIPVLGNFGIVVEVNEVEENGVTGIELESVHCENTVLFWTVSLDNFFENFVP